MKRTVGRSPEEGALRRFSRPSRRRAGARRSGSPETIPGSSSEAETTTWLLLGRRRPSVWSGDTGRVPQKRRSPPKSGPPPEPREGRGVGLDLVVAAAEISDLTRHSQRSKEDTWQALSFMGCPLSRPIARPSRASSSSPEVDARTTVLPIVLPHRATPAATGWVSAAAVIAAGVSKPKLIGESGVRSGKATFVLRSPANLKGKTVRLIASAGDNRAWVATRVSKNYAAGDLTGS